MTEYTVKEIGHQWIVYADRQSIATCADETSALKLMAEDSAAKDAAPSRGFRVLGQAKPHGREPSDFARIVNRPPRSDGRTGTWPFRKAGPVPGFPQRAAVQFSEASALADRLPDPKRSHFVILFRDGADFGRVSL
jgi:hypothetical protein